jgi:hypothetical protein
MHEARSLELDRTIPLINQLSTLNPFPAQADSMRGTASHSVPKNFEDECWQRLNHSFTTESVFVALDAFHRSESPLLGPFLIQSLTLS